MNLLRKIASTPRATSLRHASFGLAAVLWGLGCGNTEITQNTAPPASASGGAAGTSQTGAGGSKPLGGASSSGGGGSTGLPGLGGSGMVGGEAGQPGFGGSTGSGAGPSGTGGAPPTGGPFSCPGGGQIEVTPLQLTSDLNDKVTLSVAKGSSSYAASWIENPMGTPNVRVAIGSTAGLDVKPPVVTDDKPELKPAQGSSAGVAALGGQEFGLIWSPGQSPTPQGVFFKQGDGATVWGPGSLTAAAVMGAPAPRTFLANSQNYLMIGTNGAVAAISQAHTPLGAGATLSGGLNNSFVWGGDFGVFLSGKQIAKLNTNGGLVGTPTSITSDNYGDGSRGVFDGTGFSTVSRKAVGGVVYERIAPGGTAFAVKTISTTQLNPEGIVMHKGNAAVMASDMNGNLFMGFVTPGNSDAETVAQQLAFAIAGTELRDPHMFSDGDNVVVFFRAKVSNIYQVFSATITCP